MSGSMLDQPLLLPCGSTLKNRVAKAAMTENLADEHGMATARHCVLYRAWAEGGSGMLLTGNVQVDRRYLERPGNICIEGEQSPLAMERLRALAQAGSANGTQLWAQLGHAGRQSTAKVCDTPVAPSAVPMAGIPSFAVAHPRAMTADEIAELPSRFATAAAACEAAGFAGVQVHAAHGYLLSSFLNPRANVRTDGYGGPLANRARALLEAVRAVRERVGPRFGLSVKLNSSDFQKGGFTHAEAIEVACLLGHEGVDLLELSGGNYESPTITGSRASVAAGPADAATDAETAAAATAMRESTKLREAYYLLYCRDVRAALDAQAAAAAAATATKAKAKAAGMALMLTGGFRSRTAMEAALADGDLDVVGLGRPLCGAPGCVNELLADPAHVLPAFEEELRLSYGNFFGALVRRALGSFRLGQLVLVITVQAWYYDMIYRIADGKSNTPDFKGAVARIGCLGAYLRNEMEEGRKASRLVGPDCKGTHYSGREKESVPWLKLKLIAGITMAMLAYRMLS